LLAPGSTAKLEGHTLLAVWDCLFNVLAAILHIGDPSLIRNLGMHHAVVHPHLPGHEEKIQFPKFIH